MTESAGLVPAELRGPQHAEGDAAAPADGVGSGGKIGMFDFLRVVQNTGNTVRFLLIAVVLMATLVAAIGLVAKFGGLEVGQVKIEHVGALTGGTILVIQLLRLAQRQIERVRRRMSVPQQARPQLRLVRS